jgi:hypothetical protein
VEGLIKEEEYNGRKSCKLIDGNLGAKPAGMGGGAKAAVEAKAKSIEKSQERKEEGIMMSSSIRMATDVMVAYLAKETIKGPELKSAILSWRKWFIDNWDNISGAEIKSQYEQTYGQKYPEAGVDEINPDEIPF